MFNSLTGNVHSALGNKLLLKTGFIEWDIMIPVTLTDYFTPGNEVIVYTSLVHREDSMTLFGFASVSQRSLFLSLQKVEGIGPKQAVKILSAADDSDIIRNIENEDIAALSGIPGIGAKKAAKIILALKGKLEMPNSELHEEKITGNSHQDLIAALADMGFNRKDAENAVRKLSKEMDAGMKRSDMEKDLFRKAIIELS